jgi:hypothetical protein
MLTTDFISQVQIRAIYKGSSLSFDAIEEILANNLEEINKMISDGYNNSSVYDYCVGMVMEYSNLHEGDVVRVAEKGKTIRGKIQKIIGDSIFITGREFNVASLMV